jgi:hypothetical protein
LKLVEALVSIGPCSINLLGAKGELSEAAEHSGRKPNTAAAVTQRERES